MSENHISYDYKQDLFRNLFETAGDAIFVMDGKEFIDCNQMALVMFGCTREQIIGHKPHEFSPRYQTDGQLSMEKSFEQIQRSLIEHSITFEWIHCRYDKTPFFAQVSLNTLTVNGKHLTQAIVRDINDSKLARQKLAYSEEFNRKLMDASPTGIIHITKNGMITYVNNRLTEILTGTKNKGSEIVGKNIFHLSWCSSFKSKGIIEEIIHGKEVFSQEISTHITPKGNQVDIELSGAPIYNTNGEQEGAIIIIADISQRKKAESEKSKSDTKYKLIFEKSPVGIALSTIEGILLAHNSKLQEYVGYSNEELAGINAKVFYKNENDRKQILANIAENGGINSFEVELIRKDGSSFFAELNMHPYTMETEQALMVVINDITQRKEAEEYIRKLSSSVEQSPNSIVITDLSGNIEYVNPTYTNITGLNLELVKGKNSLDIIRPFNTPELIDRIQKQVKEYGSCSAEIKNRTSDGKQIWERFQISSIVNPQNKPTHYLCFHEDITHQKEHEIELKRAKDEAIKLAKIKDVFLATMSHELRTPLNAIIGFSNLIETESKDDETNYYGSIINKSGNHLLALINDMFDISLIETGRIKIFKEQFTIKSFFDEIYQIIRIEQERLGKIDLNLKVELPPHLLERKFDTDKKRLSQIFVNLLKNALKFTEKGTITFGIRIKDSSKLSFFVSDTGIGIPKDKQEKVFDIFHQIDDIYTRRSSGAGIGLSLCKNLVKCFGGNIELDSEENKGTRFTFDLPGILHGKYEEPTKIAKSPSIPDLSNKEILIAEDEESNFKLLNLILRKTGAKVHWVRNGEQAIEYCNKPTLPDLILMDIKMPKLNGFEATKIIKEQHPYVSILVQTAFAMPGDVEKAMSSGSDGYISKPVNRSKLYAELSRLLCPEHE